jgi:hypothetical protein
MPFIPVLAIALLGFVIAFLVSEVICRKTQKRDREKRECHNSNRHS